MSDEEEAVGAWQVILSVVLSGDVREIDEDKAQERLLTKMNLLVAEMRDQFPGRIYDSEIHPCTVSAQMYKV